MLEAWIFLSRLLHLGCMIRTILLFSMDRTLQPLYCQASPTHFLTSLVHLAHHPLRIPFHHALRSHTHPPPPGLLPLLPSTTTSSTPTACSTTSSASTTLPSPPPPPPWPLSLLLLALSSFLRRFICIRIRSMPSVIRRVRLNVATMRAIREGVSISRQADCAQLIVAIVV